MHTEAGKENGGHKRPHEKADVAAYSENRHAVRFAGARGEVRQASAFGVEHRDANARNHGRGKHRPIVV